ncbi:MAG: hypothetical protein RMK99_04700 [Anaerolineales bacterium]|nr:hypothetical protein [Anaerolineales bacterium]
MISVPSEATLRLPPTHSWLQPMRVAYVPGPGAEALATVFQNLLDELRAQGHDVQTQPQADTEVLLTTSVFGQPLNWRDGLLLTGRRRFGLARTPTVFTFIHVTPEALDERLRHFESALGKNPLDPADFAFEGLAPQAHRTLIEQGRRGGPIMSLIRLVQAQAVCIRIVLIVGHATPEFAYYFDLVGGHPRVSAADPAYFYADMARRLATAVSTRDITQHVVQAPPVSREEWLALTTPQAMREAGRQFGRRDFFTEMVRVQDMVAVPAVGDAIASQYSEGCFATWDERLGALIATITGSARPVVKDAITDDELAVIVGARPDGLGAVVRHVEGKRNDPPSSEAVELIDMDSPLPRISWNGATVPVARSKLHGHRGVAAFDPRHVEFVPVDEPYYHYPVSCSTDAQARAIKAAFGRSQALRNPADPRHVVFTVMPGHGVVLAEKWVAGKAPFQIVWELMDSGALQIDTRVPQGLHSYTPGPDGRMMLREG